jgi:hypothetical protein
MLPIATQPRPTNRRNLYAGLGAAVLGAAALIATISVVNSAADALTGAASSVTQDTGSDQVGVAPLLSPATCVPAAQQAPATC